MGGLTLGVITVAVGAALGYYVIGGAHPGQTVGAPAGIQETGTPPDASPQPSPTTPHRKPARANSDYTAPGAPRIRIVEAKSPSLGASPRPSAARHSSDTTATTDIPTPDAEASQEAAQAGHAAADAAPATPTGPVSDAEASQAAGPPPAYGASSASPAAPPATANASPTPDSEAGQAGDAGGAAKGAGAALYRIQAGTFADAKNARDLLTNLQSRGYDASLHADHQGGQTVYHVQVGAYHDRAAAEDAAAGFRHDGVPVTLSPINP